MHCDYNDNSNANNKPECNNDSDASNNARSDNDVLFDSEDNRSNNSTANKDIDGPSCLDSSYNSDGINIIIIEDTEKCYTTELDEYR